MHNIIRQMCKSQIRINEKLSLILKKYSKMCIIELSHSTKNITYNEILVTIEIILGHTNICTFL